MLKYFFALFVFLLLSCSKKAEEKSALKLAKSTPVKELIKDSLEKEDDKEEALENNTKYKPSNDFQKLVVDLEKKDLIYDIQRLENVKIYKELRVENITYFNDYPFYWIPLNETMVYRNKNNKPFSSYLVNLDINVFEKVKGVWGYFYRDKNSNDVIYDGVIEQWKFNNENHAIDVLNELKREGLKIYFNTNPFFCRVGNDVFIFHTRAMMFSYQQQSVFDKFVKDSNAIINY